MRCHYVYDKKAGKVLIPGCMQVINTGNAEDCTCLSENATFAGFERKVFNDEVYRLKAEIVKLEKYIHQQNRIIKKLLKK